MAEKPCGCERIVQDLHAADLLAAKAPDMGEWADSLADPFLAPSWCSSTTTVSPCSKNSSAVAHTCHSHRAPPEERRSPPAFPHAAPSREDPSRRPPDEVVGPQIEQPLEITLAVALVELRHRVRLAGDAALLSSLRSRQRRRVGVDDESSRYRDGPCCARLLQTDRWVT